MVDFKQDVHGFPYAVRKTLYMMVTDFKTEIEVASCWTCSRSTSACPGSSSTPELSEKLVTDNVVSRLKSNRAQGRPRGPSGAPPSERPPESTTPT